MKIIEKKSLEKTDDERKQEKRIISQADKLVDHLVDTKMMDGHDKMNAISYVKEELKNIISSDKPAGEKEDKYNLTGDLQSSIELGR